MYAQKLEGDSWIGEKLDKGKLDKMSGAFFSLLLPAFYHSMRMLMANGVVALIDQQLGQLYELMQTIRNNDGEGNE